MSYSAGNAPDLDRFSRPGPGERYPVNVIPLPLCECGVCGKRTTAKKLRKWNDRDVCIDCIEELTTYVAEDTRL